MLWQDLVCYQSFVLCLVIGCSEINSNHSFDLIPFRAVEYHTIFACLPVGRSVCVDAPFGALFCPWPSTRVNSAMKLAITCPFIVIRGQYCMLNSFNSIAHSAICPAASGLLIALRRGLSVRMITVSAWNYGLSFRATVANAKASFSIRGYLSSAPRSARLVKYTVFFTPFSSLTKAALTAAGEIAKYWNNSSPGLDGLSNCGEERYLFRSSNTC